MKKIKLKSLVQENILKEAEDAKIEQMKMALNDNPEFVELAWKKLQDAIDLFATGSVKSNHALQANMTEASSNKNNFIYKLAKMLVMAGITPANIHNATQPAYMDNIIKSVYQTTSE